MHETISKTRRAYAQALYFYSVVFRLLPPIRFKIPYGFIISAKYGPLKCTFKLHFQIWTLPDIKPIFLHKFRSFCCDDHFEDHADLSKLLHKIKFAKHNSHSEKTYFKNACSVFVFVFCSVYQLLSLHVPSFSARSFRHGNMLQSPMVL